MNSSIKGGLRDATRHMISCGFIKETMQLPLIAATTVLLLSSLTARGESGSLSRENAPTNAPDAVKMLVKGRDFVGLEVRNFQGQKLGKVSDIVVDVGAEHVAAVLVRVGGLTVKDEDEVVPLSAFRYEPEHRVLRLNTTKQVLKASPTFEFGRWEEFKQQPELAIVYRYYGVTPYFGDSADDSNGGQGGPEATDPEASLTDIAAAQRLRTALLKREGLSVNAKDVTIVTGNGRLTLGGFVSNEEERRAVVEVAETTVGRAYFVDHIEVKQGVPAK